MLKACDDISLSPRHYLAREWEMFQAVESGISGGQYAIWEADRVVVVLGRHTAADEWVDEAACRNDGVEVLRRCSGGGAVVLGHGCVNYAVAVPVVSRAELLDVGGSLRFVLRHIIHALRVHALGGDAPGLPDLQLAGSADLALGGRKVSGNAQRRGRRALLQHGTLLYAFDADLAVRYLREPPSQPAYRRGRTHDRFMTNLGIARAAAERALAQACTDILAASRGCPPVEPRHDRAYVPTPQPQSR
jgi:lipoate-protein ligase A